MLNRSVIKTALECLPQLPLWSLQMAYLDAFFSETRGRFDAHIVAMRLAALDAMYGMGLWKRSNAKEAGISFHNYRPRPPLMVSSITAKWNGITTRLKKHGLHQTTLRSVGKPMLAVIAAMHRSLARIRDVNTHDAKLLNEDVAASKYLHFCYPKLFPIMDSVVCAVISATPDKITYAQLLEWYWRNLNQGWTQFMTYSQRDGQIRSAVRTMDSVLWLVGLAKQWSRCRAEAMTFKKSKEVSLFFETYPQVAQKLCGTP